MTTEGKALVRKAIRELLDLLEPAICKQIRRATIVNMKAIAAITRDRPNRGTIGPENRPEALPARLTFMSLFGNM